MGINQKYSFNGIDFLGKKADRQALDDLITQKKTEVAAAKAELDAGRSFEYVYNTIRNAAYRDIKAAEKTYNDKWKNETAPKFKRKQFLDVDPKEFSDCEIVNTSFMQHEPYTEVFPRGIEKLKFIGCNLDNCIIPDGATLENCTNLQYKTQNDGERWIVDDKLAPVSPLHPAAFDKCGLSKDPASIPAVPVKEPVTIANDPKIIEQRELEALKNDPVRLKAALDAEKTSAV